MTANANLYIDGTYFEIVNDYFRFDNPRKTNIRIQGLCDLLEQAAKRVVSKRVHIARKRLFQGRLCAAEAQKIGVDVKYLHMDSNLMFNDVQLHATPIYLNANCTEKGVDVNLATTAVEDTFLYETSVAILFTGDSDFVPLIRNLRRRGVSVIVVGVDIPFEEAGLRNIRIGNSLQQEANLTVNLAKLSNETDYLKQALEGLFE